MSTRTDPRPDSAVRSARNSVYLVFFLIGFTFANWASRLPAIRDALEFEPAQMGRLLLVAAVGSIVALPLSGAVVNRIGGRKTLAIFGSFMTIGYAIAALTMGEISIYGTGTLLFLGGMGMGAADTAMNLEGSRVEQAMGKSIMPRFHGFFSFGTMVGVATGALFSWQGVGLGPHVGGALVVAFIVIHFAVRGLLPADYGVTEVDVTDLAPTDADTAKKPSVWAAWKEGNTWLIGVVVLGSALTEGAANDWLSLGIVDGFLTETGEKQPEVMGIIGLFVFLTAMTAMRLAGTYLLDNYGRVFVLRLAAGSAVIGLLLFGLAPWMWLAFVGAAFWGFGAALGFPIGMSAASDEPKQAAARVSVVATIGYTAFFAGPPLLGELAQHIGYRYAMLAILVPAVVGLLVAYAAQERGQAAILLEKRRNERGVSTAAKDYA